MPYLVLNYLVGANLEQYVTVRRMELAELKPVVRDVCLGLRALHERRIVHRDLKPANIFLRLALPVAAEERFQPAHRDAAAVPLVEAVLIDFGIARIVDGSQSELGGTLGFLSPEQANEKAIDTRSDIYSLAATIYWAMTGRCFFEEYASSQPMWILAHAEEDPFENGMVQEHARRLPPKLVELLRAAVARDSRSRPDAWTFAQRFAAL
jgi:serine/threonine protein kinase